MEDHEDRGAVRAVHAKTKSCRETICSKLMGWTAPALAASRCVIVVAAAHHNEGSRPHAAYHDRSRHREARFSGAWRGCGRLGCTAPANSPFRASGLLQGVATMLDGRGSGPWLVNTLRGHLAEFGVTAAKGISCSIASWHQTNEVSRRLETTPGGGGDHCAGTGRNQLPIGTSVRRLIGLAPRLNGTGGKVQLGRISKAGNRYLRRLLTLGATSVVRYARRKPERAAWINVPLARRPTRVVITAVANKVTRIIWAVLSHGESFRRSEAAAA